MREQNTVSVEQAINMGRLLVVAPSLLLMGGSIMACGWLVEERDYTPWLILAGFVVGGALGSVWWSISVTRWRLWAFSQVKQVHLLKKLAIVNRIIAKDGSWSKKIEISTAVDRQRWMELQSKFEVEDDFEEQKSLLKFKKENRIYYSLFTFLITLVMFIVAFTLLVYGAITLNWKGIAIGGIGALFTGYYVVKFGKRIKNPAIILNEKGVFTQETGWVDWELLVNLKVVHHTPNVGNDKSIFQFSYLDSNNRLRIIKSDEHDVSELGISIFKLEALINAYRELYMPEVRVIDPVTLEEKIIRD